MVQHRGAVIGWSGAVSAVAIAAATLFATAQKDPFGNPLVITFAVIAAIGFLMLVAAGIPDVGAWAVGGLRVVLPQDRPTKVDLDCWSYATDGMSRQAAFTALEVTLPGVGYMKQPEDRPPWIRYAVLLGCSSISTDFDARQARARFLAFLSAPPVSGLISDLVAVPDDAAWTSRAAHGSAFNAVLGSGDGEGAVVSARLELPDGTHRFGRDGRCAVLIIHAEAPAHASRGQASWFEWADRVTRVLQAVPALAEFLHDQLGLQAPADPPAQAAVRLETLGDLTDLITTPGLDPLPGGGQ